MEVHWPVPRLLMCKAIETLFLQEATGQSFTGRQQQMSHIELREPWAFTQCGMAVYLN